MKRFVGLCEDEKQQRYVYFNINNIVQFTTHRPDKETVVTLYHLGAIQPTILLGKMADEFLEQMSNSWGTREGVQ